MFAYPQALKLKVAGGSFKPGCCSLFFELGKTLGVPELEVFAHADKGHFLFETCESTQVGRNQHATSLVNREINALPSTMRCKKRAL